MKKLNNLGIAHFLIPLIVVIVGVAAVGTYMKVSSNAASISATRSGKKCNVNVGSVNALYPESGGGWTGYTRAYVSNCNFKGAGLTDNTISFCKIDSRTNPRDHGPCYKNKSAISIGRSSYGLGYDLQLRVGGKRKAPQSIKLVVITNPGDRPHYDFVTLRR